MRILGVLILTALGLAAQVPTTGCVAGQGAAFCLGPVTPPVVVTRVGGCTNFNTVAASTSCSLAVLAGDLIIANSRAGNTSGTGTPTFSSPAGPACPWLPASTISDVSTGNGFNSVAYTCIVPTSGTETVQVGWTGVTQTNANLSVTAYRTSGTFPNPVVDRQIFTQTSVNGTTCPTGTTLATQNPNDIIVAICQTTDNSQTWPALAGYTQEPTSSRTTTGGVGFYDAIVTTTGAQTAAIPLAPSTTGTAFILALQASSVVDGTNAAFVQSANSSGQSPQSDHVSLTGVVAGDLLIYWVYHSNYTGTGTVNMSDSQGNVWYPCDTNTGGGTSITVSDNHNYNSTYGATCFYAWAVRGGTVVGLPTATDCSVACTFVGSNLAEFKNVTAWDAGAVGAGTSSAGSNNMSCPTVTATQAHDLITCSLLWGSGAVTPGTSPITFTIFPGGLTNGSGEYAVWNGSGAITPTETNTGGAGILYGGYTVAFK